MQQLLTWDEQLFRFFNNGLANPFFDFLMPWIRNAEFWAPLYLFLIVFALTNFKNKGWQWILFFIITATLTDTVSSKIIKQLIWRDRPFDNPALAQWIRLLVSRPSNSSFVSSHAANHFGAAAYAVYTLKRSGIMGKWVNLFYAWAALVCVAQLYVGVHYPIDIICGAIIGFYIGYGVAFAFNRIWGLPVYRLE